MITETAPKGARMAGFSAAGAVLYLAASQGQLHGGVRWSITRDGLAIGRDLRNGPFRLADPRLSRVHAVIEPCADGRHYQVRDLGSRNGTAVNGQPLEGARRLVSGDVLHLGDTLAVFAAPAVPPGRAPPALGLVGQSLGIVAVREAVERVARRSMCVLVTGETGVGKEVVASAVHTHSGRTGPFVAVNCGGIAETLMDGELFGHVRGAFTGAVADRQGLFRAAHGGTLFLDEIGEMPAALQVKLLRVLDRPVVRPVGGSREETVDVRVVAATHRDLPAEVQAGRFRADLFARLAQWLVVVPPLRERREDIPLLIRFLLGRLGAEGRALDTELCEALLTCDWALNVRGLVNALSAAVIAGRADGPLTLGPEVANMIALGRRLTPAPDEAAAPAPAPAPEARPAPRDAPPPVEELRAALRQTRGNVADAARRLSCSRQQLYRWMQASGVALEEFRA